MNNANAQFFVPLTLMVAGGVLAAVAVVGHRWSSRLIQHGRYLAYLAVRLGVSILAIGALFAIPLALVIVTDSFYPGYKLHGGEAPGPMGDGGGSDLFFTFCITLWPLGIVVLLIYAIVSFFRFFRDNPAEPEKSA